MGILVNNPKTVPALSYNRIHMDELVIKQKELSDWGKLPHYELLIKYRLFAVDDSQVIHYNPKVYYIHLSDYLEEAQRKAATGDMDMITALSTIEMALASLIEDQDRHGAAEPL